MKGPVGAVYTICIIIALCLMGGGTAASVSSHHHGRMSSDSSLSWTCPSVCTCSKTGASVNCQGKRLTSVPVGIPPQVEKLYLDDNNFVLLATNSLANFTHLSQVHMRNSHIQTVQAGAFRNLPALKELYLTNNNIARLLPEVFQGVDILSMLNLQANKMTSLPDLRTLPALKTLSLEANLIQNATIPASYANLSSLNSIVLSNNNITHLSNQSFVALSNSTVRRLEIARNGLKNVSAGALRPLRSLQSLKIGQNPLDGQQLQHVLEGLREDSNLLSLDIHSITLGGTLPSVSFSILSATLLKTLIFNNNEVRKIPEKAFAELPKLLVLDLSACQVQEVADHAFVDLPDLRDLILKDNLFLQSVPKYLPDNLQRLYLQGNSISVLKDGDLKNLGQLRELYLSDNQIHELPENSFMGLVNLRILHLQNNRLSYIPGQLFAPLTNLLTLILKNNNLRSLKLSPGTMSSLVALTSLDMSSNQCNYIPFDFFKDLSSLQTLNLDNNDLGGLMAADSSGQLLGQLRKLQNLNLARNNLHYIHDAQFRNLFELQHLNLKANQLSSWGPQLFHTPGTVKKSLKTVDLSNNQIALVNKTSVRDLEHIQMLNLSLNPFACTCDLRWFRQWLDNATVRVADKSSYKCNSPAAWNGRPLLEFGPDKIDCTDYTWIYVGTAIAVTFVFALIIFSILYHRRWFIRLRLYRLQKAVRNGCCKGTNAGQARRDGFQQLEGQDVTGRRFDFYVICTEMDEQWVIENLLPVLDNGPTMQDQAQRYPGQFSLYFEERDGERGNNRVANFDESMKLCRAALVVLTAHLEGEAFCRFLLEQAFELRIEGDIERILVIKVGEVQARRVPRRLHSAMERNEFREWLHPGNVQQEFVNYLENALQQGQGQGQMYEAVEAPRV